MNKLEDRFIDKLSNNDGRLLDFLLVINGLDIEIEVLDFSLEEGLSELFRLEVNISIAKNFFVAEDNFLDLSGQLLKEVSFRVRLGNKILRTVDGIISSIRCVNSSPNKIYYGVEVSPKLWVLTLNQNSRIYYAKSVPEVVVELLSDYEIQLHKDCKDSLLDKHVAREYITQKRESDYDFFCRLMAEEGIVFYFKDNCLFYTDSHPYPYMDSGLKLIYNPDPQAAIEDFVIDKLELSSNVTANQVLLKDYKYTHPRTVLLSKSRVNDLLQPVYEQYESYGRFSDEETAQQFARYRLDALTNDSLVGKARSNCVGIMPGKLFKITNHSMALINSKWQWQVIKVKHYGAMTQLVTEGSESSKVVGNQATLHNEFSFIAGTVNWRSPFRYKPQADGDELATVVGPKDEEIYVNAEGAVKVHFHWDYRDHTDEHNSVWVRVAQSVSGDGFGFVAIPRIGQEVIVSYLNGDIDSPIIVGSLYNGCNQPPVNLLHHKTQTMIKTKTHKGEGFNELRFEDEDGKQEIYMHAQRDMIVHVLNNKTEQVQADRIVDIGSNEQIFIGKSRCLMIVGDQEHTTSGNYKELIKQDKSLDIEGDLRQQIAGNAEIRVKHGLVLQSDEQLTFKVGNSSIVVEESGIYINSANVYINDNKSSIDSLKPINLDFNKQAFIGSSMVNMPSNINTVDLIDNIKTSNTQSETENINNDQTQTNNKPNQNNEDEEKSLCCYEKILNEAKQHSNKKTNLSQILANFERNFIALKKAYLAQAVYKPSEEAKVSGWRIIDNDIYLLKNYGLNLKDFVSASSSFKFIIYEPIIGELKCDNCAFICSPQFGLKPVIVFKGTDLKSLEDWDNNTQQAINLYSKYYEKAVDIGNKIKVKGKKVEFVGHSLGGGLASAAAQASGMPATTFNAAGLHRKTVNRYGGDVQNSKILAYRVKGEILTTIQEEGISTLDYLCLLGASFTTHNPALICFTKSFMPDAVGIPYELEGETSSSVTLHSIEQVIVALQKQNDKDLAIITNAIEVSCS